jgi:diphthamide synthase (EF-2-diphthine--ammonia ligase)
MVNLLDQMFIGRLIDHSFVKDLPEGVDVCGENGEYHTFCFSGPIFKYPVPYTLEIPFEFSHAVGMEDGTQQTFTYWFVNLM